MRAVNLRDWIELARPLQANLRDRTELARPWQASLWPGASWLAASLPWAPWLARFVGPARFWLALAGSMWPRAARSGCPGRSGWLALDAQGTLGLPWLANDCPIDAIGKKKSICFSTILLRGCLLRALWYVSSCLKSSV